MPIDPSELSEQELLDLAVSNPRVLKAITDADPRVKLHELLYNSDKKLDGKRVDGRPFREVIEEMGVEIAPDSHLARSRRHARAEVQPVLEEVNSLRAELKQEREASSRRQWRETLRSHVEASGRTVDDTELDRIETFMVENQYGPKAAAKAVEVYLETQYPVEPNYESTQTFTLGNPDDEHTKELLKLGPGDDLGPNSSRGIANAERVWREMFGTDKKRSPTFTATP